MPSPSNRLKNNKAALFSIFKLLPRNTVVHVMSASKNFKNVGSVALRKHKNNHEERMRRIARLKNRVRTFVKNIQANAAYRKSAKARIRKHALISLAHELGVYKHVIPMIRGGYLLSNSTAPKYLNNTFKKNLGIITPGGYFRMYPHPSRKRS